MNRLAVLFTCLLMGLLSGAFAGEWRQLDSLPDKEGFAGSFAGVSNDVLLVAGGANFPEKRPAEGGTKVWYDHVFALDTLDAEWKNVGRLPRPLGYGVSSTYRNGVVCVGGSDSQRHYDNAFRLEFAGKKLRFTELPPLPCTIANACGAIVGDILYIAGGQAEPTSNEPLATLWRIDLSVPSPKWDAMPELPGPGRILAVAASLHKKLYVAGGAALKQGGDDKVQREYLVDAYCFDPAIGWNRIADLPRPVTAAASPTATDASGFFIFGGDDGTQVGIGTAKHQGFSSQVLRYDAVQNRWSDIERLPAARVTLPCVNWRGAWVFPSGEQLPGVRSPQVWMWTGGKMHE